MWTKCFTSEIGTHHNKEGEKLLIYSYVNIGFNNQIKKENI